MENNRLEFVAEVGSTWRVGDWKKSHVLAVGSIYDAARAGATAVKFQVWEADSFYSKTRAAELHARARYYELPVSWLQTLQTHAVRCGISLWASVFSPKLVDEVAPYVNVLKVASGDLTYEDLLRASCEACAGYAIPLCVSTGAATQEEVERAIGIVREYDVPELILMHCVSTYPAEPTDYNLLAGAMFDTVVDKIGLSDHTLYDVTAAQIAVGMGYTVFEKHFMPFGADLNNPDACVATDGEGFKLYVDAVKEAQMIVGRRVKTPVASEVGERLWSRRGKDGLRPTEEAVAQ
jgi:N,N'-diacetyllegionaminate synthase